MDALVGISELTIAYSVKTWSLQKVGVVLVHNSLKYTTQLKKAMTLTNFLPPDGIEIVKEFSELAPDARAFLAHAEKRCYEFGADWFANLVETVYGEHPNLRFYVLREGGAVIALMATRLESTIFGSSLHSLGNFYTTLFEPLLAPEAGAAAVAKVLIAAKKNSSSLRVVQFTPMDREERSFSALRDGMRMAGLRPFEYFAFGNWYQPVVEDWADYLSRRSGTLRSTIKRMTKKFDADGGTLELISSMSDLKRGIVAYETVYAASWKQEEPFPKFIPGLLDVCAQAGSLRLGIAWLSGKPIAAQFWIVCHGRAAIYKVAYDEQFKAYAPGTLLTALLMKNSIEVDAVTEVDYLIGDDPYKKTWMSHRRERWGIIAYNPRSVGGMFGWIRELMARRIKAVRQRSVARSG